MALQLKKWLLNFVSPAHANAGETRRNLFFKLKRISTFRVEAEMKNWRSALVFAENPRRPDRRMLYAIYQQLELDDQIAAQTRIAKITVQRAPFELRKNGKADEKAFQLFDITWFDSYLQYAVDSEFWGHSLLEFKKSKKDFQFETAYLIPREHVRPEFGDVLVNINDQKGIPFRDNKQYPFLIEIGTWDDLGILKIAAIPAIRKRYADTDWSVFSEKFGMPLLSIKTTTREKRELDAKEDMAKNFGANGYLILDDQDDVSMVVSNPNGTAHAVYQDRMKLADEQIAKIINGQTGTSDVKAFAGSAQVHERMLNDFTFSRLARIQRHINNQLIPFLIKHHYPLDNFSFHFTELESQSDKQSTTPVNQKKKPTHFGFSTKPTMIAANHQS